MAGIAQMRVMKDGSERLMLMTWNAARGQASAGLGEILAAARFKEGDDVVLLYAERLASMTEAHSLEEHERLLKLSEAELELRGAEGATKWMILINGTVHPWAGDRALTGRQLRAMASPPIPEDHDLFACLAIRTNDERVELDQPVELRVGMWFYSAPAKVNGG